MQPGFNSTEVHVEAIFYNLAILYLYCIGLLFMTVNEWGC